MDNVKKKRIKKYISWILLAVLVTGLAVMPLVATSEEDTDGPVASILSGTVETGSISTGLKGGGTLTSQEAMDVTIPTGVKITEFLVKNGDVVSKGDPLATIDRVTLMNTITSVQETMDYLIEEMADVTNESASTKVTAEAGGLVKVIYAEEGDSVQDVMLQHGALAVLSLDGLMAVEIERKTDLTTGDSVTVIFEDGTEVSGRVDSNMDGILEVTVEDDGYEVGTKVVVTTGDGDRIGSGELYVHNAWNAVAYTGTVSKINAKTDKTVSSGTTLITLKDTEFNAQLQSLLSQYSDYEKLMLELFQMYQQDAITAPCDGKISGVDEDSMQLLSANGSTYTLSLLANAPNGNDEASYVNFVGMVTSVDDQGNLSLVMNPNAIEIIDYTDLSGVPTDPTAMTMPSVYIPMAPIYELTGGAWTQISAASISANDILLFAHDESGNTVWVVRISAAQPDTPEDTQPTVPDASTPPSESTEPTQPGETPTEPSLPGETPTEPESGTESTVPNPDGTTENPLGGITGSMGSIVGGLGGMSGMSGYFGGYTQEETFELFDLEGTVLMSVTPQETMTLSIAVDEQDISKVQLGMTADVTVTALKNETFTATVTEIGDTGTNNGGSSKFTVELTLALTEDMLEGMTAVATIPMNTTENIPVIPVEALVEIGSKTYVYTGYDEKSDTLTNMAEVTLGVSDGIHAEVLSGLSVGDTYWYSYYDTLEIDNTAESGFGFGRFG